MCVFVRESGRYEGAIGYEVGVTNKALFELILYVQYQPQHYNFVELARRCFEEKKNDAAWRCRCIARC